ncbi:MAG: hypothetical protein SNJ76_07765 [Fimbriimonadaceae bacterium]
MPRDFSGALGAFFLLAGLGWLAYKASFLAMAVTPANWGDRGEGLGPASLLIVGPGLAGVAAGCWILVRVVRRRR